MVAWNVEKVQLKHTSPKYYQTDQHSLSMQVLQRVFRVDEILKHLPRQEGKSHRHWIGPWRTLSYGYLEKSMGKAKNLQRAVTD